jgi:nicotinamide-nucleotide amidase
MPSAEIITIGTELLLGVIQDTNTRYIANHLKNSGYDLFRTTTIGDNQNRIAQLLLESLSRADFVITTGGLGPTVDDPTREAVAQAFDCELIFHQELWQQIETRFLHRGLTPTENNKKQALIPKGAFVLENQFGTAPAFILPVGIKYVICLPGVPKEMENLMEQKVLPFLKVKIPSSHALVTRTLHAIGIGESSLDSLIGAYERLSNPTVGLLAHPGIVDIRIGATSDSVINANHMIDPVEEAITNLIPDNIYGKDETSIEFAIVQLAEIFNKPIYIHLMGFPYNFELSFPDPKKLIYVNMLPLDESTPFHDSTNTITLILSFLNDRLNDQLHVTYKTAGQSTITKTYMGPPLTGMTWVTNTVLYYIWKEIQTHIKAKDKNE